MNYFGIFLALIGTVCLELVRPAFAHGVHSGTSGCAVGACGVTYWHLTQRAFDSMLYISIVIYGAIMILFWFSLIKRKPPSAIVRK